MNTSVDNEEKPKFRVCHGYKIDHELILWAKGKRGMLSDEEEKLCKVIILENAKGKKVFTSVEEALKAEIEEIPPKIGHIVAIRTCAHMLDEAEDIGLIDNISDVYAFMDYCMFKFGYDHIDRVIPDTIKTFIDIKFERDPKIRKVLEKLHKS